jgi:hypothetical protein
MKSLKLVSVMFFIVAFFGSISSSKSQGINYELEYSLSSTSNGLFLVSTCNNNGGSACNMPGSVHRTDVSWLVGFIF